MAAFLLLGIALAQHAVSVMEARQGYAARGVILDERNGTLLLTTTPCAREGYKSEVRFRMPYLKTPTDPIECSGRSYPQFIVRQQ
jgi:hypothetical protein